jgi:hypothetical protein
MKKIYPLIILVALTFVMNAQNFTSIVPDITITGQPGVFTFEGSIDLANNTFGDLAMGYELIEETVPFGWETSNCLGANCLPIGVTSGTFSLPVLSPDNYVIGHFYPNNVAGSGHMKIRIYELFNPNVSLELTYYGVAGVVSGVEELEDKDVQVFPNPMSDFLTIMLPNDNGVDIEIEIIDALGRLVKTEILNQSTTQLDLSDLNAGVYYLSTGSIRKKFIKK